MPEYTFDVKLFASFKITADSEEAARAQLAWLNDSVGITVANDRGNRLDGACALDDDAPDLFAIDGEAVPAESRGLTCPVCNAPPPHCTGLVIPCPKTRAAGGC